LSRVEKRRRLGGASWLSVLSCGAALILSACGSGSSALSDGDGPNSANSSDAGAGSGADNGGRSEDAVGADASSLRPADSEPEGDDAASDDAESEDDPAPERLVSEEDVLLVDNSDAGQFRCEREVTFEAVELEEPPPFDVVIVADHSDSLSWSKDELAAGLSDLLDDVYGHDARFFVLTPTQYGASSAGAMDWNTGRDLVQWRDPVSGLPYENEMTRYVASCVDGEVQPRVCPSTATDEPFTVNGVFEFVMPEPVAEITREMGKPEIAEQRDALSFAITNLGGRASQVEQPVCTLNRYVSQSAAALPENVVFLVISDEDDTSSPNDCIASYRYTHQQNVNMRHVPGCTGDCDFWRSTVQRSASSRQVNYLCVPVDDFGMTFPEQAVADGSGLSSVPTCEGEPTECTAGDLDRAASDCGAGFAVEACTRSCTEASTVPLCSVDLVDGSPNPCNASFEYRDNTYANLAAFCEEQRSADGWTECRTEGYTYEESITWGGSVSKSSVVSAGSVLDMIRGFQVEATNVFGEDGYYVATIAFDPSFSCELEAGQSHATTLRMVSAGPSDVFPICESYAPVLSEIQLFAKALLPTEYTVDVTAQESIEAVTVDTRDGDSRELDPADYNYDPETSTLTVGAEALDASDVGLSVDIVDPCARRVR
jgi:hypothetical protein